MARRQWLTAVVLLAALAGGWVLARWGMSPTAVPTSIAMTRTVPTEEVVPAVVPSPGEALVLISIPRRIPAQTDDTVLVRTIDAVTGEPIPGVSIGLAAHAVQPEAVFGNDIVVRVTDARGALLIPAAEVPMGATVVGNHDGYSPHEVRLAPSVRELTLKLIPTLSIEGRVIDFGTGSSLAGIPIAVTAVRALDVSPAGGMQRPGLERSVVVSGVDGAFRAHVGAGLHRLCVLSEDHALHWESGIDARESFDRRHARVVRAGSVGVDLRLSAVRYLRLKLVDADSERPISSLANAMVSYDPRGPDRRVCIESGPTVLGGTVVQTESLADPLSGVLARRVRIALPDGVPEDLSVDVTAPGYAGTHVRCRLLSASQLREEHRLSVVRLKACASATGRLTVRATGGASPLRVRRPWQVTALDRGRRDGAIVQLWSLAPTVEAVWTLAPWPAGTWEIDLAGGVYRSRTVHVTVPEHGSAEVDLPLIEVGVLLGVRNAAGAPLPYPSVLFSGEPADPQPQQVASAAGVTTLGPPRRAKKIVASIWPCAGGEAPEAAHFFVDMGPGRWQLHVAHAGYRTREVHVMVPHEGIERADIVLEPEE